MNEKDINAAVDYIYTQGKQYAQAKAHRVYLEEYKRSLRSIIMKRVIAEKKASSSAAAEMEAYADESYIQLLKGLQEATEQEEALRWGLVSAQARIDVWRSLEASNRTMDRVTM